MRAFSVRCVCMCENLAGLEHGLDRTPHYMLRWSTCVIRYVVCILYCTHVDDDDDDGDGAVMLMAANIENEHG